MSAVAADARRASESDAIREAARRLVETAPPLSQAQIERLRALFGRVS